MTAYNPMSYHNGSVWPHDNALCAAGLIRYGFAGHAQRIAEAVFDAAGHSGHRLPELFCGFSRTDYPVPVPYPTPCWPQPPRCSCCTPCSGSPPNSPGGSSPQA